MSNVINIDRKKVHTAAFFAMEKVYVKEFVRRTPGDGETHQSWFLEDRGYLTFAMVNPARQIINVLEGGRKPGIIRARRKKFLKFKKPKTRKKSRVKIPGNVAFEKNGFIYAKAVYHPGFKGRHFVNKIMNDKTLKKNFKTVFENKLVSLM